VKKNAQIFLVVVGVVNGHLVLICAECHRPHHFLKVNKLCWHPAAQMGMAKTDFSPMHRSRSGFDYECRTFRSDWSRSIYVWLWMQLWNDWCACTVQWWLKWSLKRSRNDVAR